MSLDSGIAAIAATGPLPGCRRVDRHDLRLAVGDVVAHHPGSVSGAAKTDQGRECAGVVGHAMPDDDGGAEVLGEQRDPPWIVSLEYIDVD